MLDGFPTKPKQSVRGHRRDNLDHATLNGGEMEGGSSNLQAALVNGGLGVSNEALQDESHYDNSRQTSRANDYVHHNSITPPSLGGHQTLMGNELHGEAYPNAYADIYDDTAVDPVYESLADDDRRIPSEKGGCNDVVYEVVLTRA